MAVFPLFSIGNNRHPEGYLITFYTSDHVEGSLPRFISHRGIVRGNLKLDWVLTEAGPLSPLPNLIATLGMVLMPQRTIRLIQPLLSVIQTKQRGGREWKS